jgi:hypothetical protein
MLAAGSEGTTEVEGLRSLSAITLGVPACFALPTGLSGGTRYPDGGGLTAEGRARREEVRLQGAQMFGQGIKPTQVARFLRVSTKSDTRDHQISCEDLGE